MPSIYPNTTTSSLHLLFGYVASGAVAATSKNLSTLASFFSAADVGARIMILGAGAAGAPLFTTIDTFTDPTHVVLHDAAITTVTATSQNVVIFRETKSATDAPTMDSLRFTSTAQARDTFSFTFKSLHSAASPSTTFSPAEGQPVLLVDDVLGEIFGGTIDQAVIRNIPGNVGIFTDCIGVTYDLGLYTRSTARPTGPGSPPQPNAGTFTNQTLGQIATYLVGLLATNGYTISTVSGPIIPSYSVRYAQIGAALDEICQLSSNATDQYKWYTDSRRVVHLIKLGTVAAPWNVTYSDSSDRNILAEATATFTRQNYANRAIVKIGKLAVDVVTEAFVGNTSLAVFETSLPLSAAPTIVLQISSPVSVVPQTVGVLGIDSGMDWYWSLGSNVITQDPAGALLNSFETMEVTYQGQNLGVIISTNTAEIARRAAKEGGSGIYETVQDAGTPASLADAQTLAAAIANSQGVIPETVGYGIYRGGLVVGQTQRIDILELGVSDLFVIDTITMTTRGGLVLWQVTATRGPMVLNWANMLQSSIVDASAASNADVGLPDTGRELVTNFTVARSFVDRANGALENSRTTPGSGFFEYNGYLYFAGVNHGQNAFSVWRSSDKGRTWTALDSANQPTDLVNGIGGTAVYPGTPNRVDGGHTIYCLLISPNSSSHLYFQAFDLITETWGLVLGGAGTGPVAQSVKCVFLRYANKTLFAGYDIGAVGAGLLKTRFWGVSFRLDTNTYGAPVDIGFELTIANGNTGGNTSSASTMPGVMDGSGRIHFFIIDSLRKYFWYQAIELDDSRGGFFFFATAIAPNFPNTTFALIQEGVAIISKGRPIWAMATNDGGTARSYRLIIGNNLSPTAWSISGVAVAMTSPGTYVGEPPCIVSDERAIVMLVRTGTGSPSFLDVVSYYITQDLTTFTGWTGFSVWSLAVENAAPPAGFDNTSGLNNLMLSPVATDPCCGRALAMVMGFSTIGASNNQAIFAGEIDWSLV